VGTRGRLLVDRINGVRINKLEDVLRAFEKHTGTYDTVEFVPHDYFECLERAEVAKANPRIMKNYNIPADRRL
jgi:hypothetical protein